MLGEDLEKFVYKNIGPVIILENELKPNQVITTILGILLGSVFGVAIL